MALAGATEAEAVMVHIETTAEEVVVKGELLDEACEEFTKALESLRRSRFTWTAVDLSRVTAATERPISSLFALWLDMFRQRRAPYINAPEHIWRMLGRAAVDQRFISKHTGDVQDRP